MVMKVEKKVTTQLLIETLKNLNVTYSSDDIMPVKIIQQNKDSISTIQMRLHQLDTLIEALQTLRENINEG